MTGTTITGDVMTDEPTLPAPPEKRSITPAPEDFRTQPSIRTLLWPLAWFGIAVALWAAVKALGWMPFEHT